MGIEKPGYTNSDFSTVVSQILLHEIAHSLIDDNEHFGDASVRNGRVSTPEMLLPDYQRFLKSDIKEIQEHSRASIE